jgi:hypothetical protein
VNYRGRTTTPAVDGGNSLSALSPTRRSGGHAQIIEALVEAKANVGAEDAYNRTHLHYAAHTGGVLPSSFLFVPSSFSGFLLLTTVTVPHSRHTLDMLDLLSLLLLHLMALFFQKIFLLICYNCSSAAFFLTNALPFLLHLRGLEIATDKPLVPLHALVIHIPLRLQQAFDTRHIVKQVLNHYHVKTDVGEVDRLEHSELSALHI